jgi:hypothetical protein
MIRPLEFLLCGIRARFIGERLQIFSLFTYSLEKPQKIVDIFLITYKHFDPFAITT